MEQTRMLQYLTLIFLLVIGLNLSGCAKTTVVLLPDPDGKVGIAAVRRELDFRIGGLRHLQGALHGVGKW